MIKGSLENRTIRKVQRWTQFNRDGLMQVWTSSRTR